MATTNVSIRLGVEGQAQVKRAFDEVGKAGQDSFRGVGTAMDAAGAATDRETQRLQRLAQAAKQAQAAEAAQRNFNAALGVDRPAAGSARESARVFEDTSRAAEDLEARTAALRAQIDPLGDAQRRMNAEIAEADSLFQAGAITQKEPGDAVALRLPVACHEFDRVTRSSRLRTVAVFPIERIEFRNHRKRVAFIGHGRIYASQQQAPLSRMGSEINHSIHRRH